MHVHPVISALGVYIVQSLQSIPRGREQSELFTGVNVSYFSVPIPTSSGRGLYIGIRGIGVGYSISAFQVSMTNVTRRLPTQRKDIASPYKLVLKCLFVIA